jgi:hypothetical protein
MIGRLVRESLRRNRLLAGLGFAHLALFVFLIFAAFLDPMQILGVSRWIKPMKFAISIAIFLVTMAWLLSYLEPRRRRAVAWLSGAIALAMTGEMVLILMQSARGVRSHFNNDSGFDAAVFSAMGALILLNTAAAVVVWLLFLLRGASIDGAQLSGVRLGLAFFIFASLIGGMMIRQGSHSIGVHDGQPGLPFVNWSTGAGDLRVAHFFGMHALQALPVLGWFLDRRRIARGRLWIQLTAAAFALLTTLLLFQALAGKPLL